MNLTMVRERILETPLVSSLPQELQRTFVMIILWISDVRDVSRQERLYTLGDQDANEGCVILEGMVRVITEETDSKSIEAPDILGEVQLVTPQRTRTATVEVVVGGQILSFSWSQFGKVAKEVFSEEQMKAVKKHIADSAWQREDNLAEKIARRSK